ncbi:DUF4328 domain-containing protein [Streptomyces prunicolor]|uniref:DUF4328 domain-containing protein n=1 Tax=Streptomyces prunicolor TaxID=67348 RepID=UPI00224CBA8A|nr:DUF4328 domain-containing protein [Streptomyces prunicolor]MCX5236940.1 DUF4328 domain-containing protein [Streptomyces prunicolor]
MPAPRPTPGPYLRSPVGLGRAAVALLGLVIAVDLFAVYADFVLYDVTGDLMDGAAGGAVTRRLDDAETLNSVAGGIQSGALVTCAIVYLCWFVRVRANAGVFDPGEQSMKPWWAIGGWFVPFVNLWYPRRVTLEIWDASRPVGARRSHALVNIWWTLWLLSLFSDRLGITDYGKTEAADQINAAAYQLMISDGLDIAAAALAILVVLRLTRMQHEKALAGPGVPVGL